ncbi:TIGR03621 family F420-dependent LLM class oxidoreductase [Pseudonocardia sp. CA-107938]|uniref:TIGR03621 family F420-dependent LLM class oxidoreductase n=1 Tax=Pseudonocardia sp. CA-107938 TaxID=3240021 RepID=UPI003D8B210A
MRPFRFGVNLLDPTVDWTATSRRVEELGYDVLLVPDHLGFPAPFPALVAAAAATERVRLGTFVLNAAFYNATVLARDVAATDALTGGRFELGLGAGYVKTEFDAAGIPFGSGGTRLDHLATVTRRVQELLADPEHRPAPAQRPVPLLLGGQGNRMLRLAATTADIVGFTGLSSDAEGNLQVQPAAALDERVAFVRAAAGERFEQLELNLLVQVVDTSASPDQGPAALAEQYGTSIDPATLAEVPTFLFGPPEQLAEELTAARDRYGISYFTVLSPFMEQFAEVAKLLR